MWTGRAVLIAVTVLAGLWWVLAPAAAMAGGYRHAGGWTSEQRWSLKNDWEPNIAADPSSLWLYQMTTQYGGSSACRPDMGHCILWVSMISGGR